MTDLDSLWLAALQEVVARAAHEVKDSLNGVSLNLEVIRSRTAAPGGSSANGALTVFSTAAVEQLELLTLRTDAVLFLARPAKGQTDVATILKHLASLLIPATRADGGRLAVDGYQTSAPTGARATAVRLALAAPLLGITKNGGSGQCRLDSDGETMVRFSHESARPWSLDEAVASVLAEHSIRTDRSGSELIMRFPT